MSAKAPRRLVFATAPVALAAVALWTATQGRASESEDPDLHAGHGAEHAAAPSAPWQVADGGLVTLDAAGSESLGVTVVEAEFVPVHRSIRTTGHVAFDETRLTTFAPKFAGFVERLYVDFTGQAVRRGQPLLEIYSPELLAAQEELLAARALESRLRESATSAAASARAATLVEAARRRLLLWDVPAAQVAQIEASGQVRRTLTLHAPAGGFVIEKMVQAGQAVEAGMPLYRLADLASVWVEVDVYEQDLRFVGIGKRAELEIAAYPGERFQGRVSYVYPEVRMDTRTARVRVELANSGGRIRPGMYATVELEAQVSAGAVVVPRDAVMHGGTHAMVFVEEAPGIYRAREVTVGSDAGGRTEILSGLLAGERVVGRANFLLDSESRLAEGLGAMPGMDH
jgi:membrane fusion protein, copper/silver efflux system